MLLLFVQTTGSFKYKPMIDPLLFVTHNFKQIIVPDLTDLDNNRLWCRFRRPLLTYGPTSINPTRSMYHYYFKGPKNDSGIYLPENIYKMNISPRQYNITEFYTDVQISNRAFLPVASRHLLVVIFLLLVGLHSRAI
ncbi:hypothetical protein DAPPUDRAFT_309734 [Daphnia pulex]|uniref:Uncharacterized protein n=1 Tax=Daphnia pulex TaxID=6669 RepID=E9FQM9_DAPPU|nr:hypothetical protein DAPPUDRAFT_309734 [Daphnia pulex]|eukprot:EFX90337.1 hypothetical protein DAPPUDRAFT_309734 [Daphnia pulex]